MPMVTANIHGPAKSPSAFDNPSEMCIRDSPNTIALEEVERIFVGMGYEVVELSLIHI